MFHTNESFLSSTLNVSRIAFLLSTLTIVFAGSIFASSDTARVVDGPAKAVTTPPSSFTTELK
jgi:hypothetical protein